MKVAQQQINEKAQKAIDQYAAEHGKKPSELTDEELAAAAGAWNGETSVSGVSAGAGIGTAFEPGLGTAIGAGIGDVVGGFLGDT